MTVVDDTLKGTTLGEPDGPPRFIETLGCEVPTFIDPRLDLLVDRGTVKAQKRLDYHVPFKMRGDFKPEDWPKEYRAKVGKVRTDYQGYVICDGITRTGNLCMAKAVNRTHKCRPHGGALHPSDKKISIKTIASIPEGRIENLDRTQKFMQGFLSVEELDDDEITGNFVRNNDGIPIHSKFLGKKFEHIIMKELHARLNRYLMSKTPRALEVLYQIIDSEIVEPADRLKAIQMLTDRTLGKAADVVINYKSEEKPYESIIERVEGGSREAYRNHVESTRLALGGDNQGSGIRSDDRRSSEIYDAEEVSDEDDYVDGMETDYLEVDVEVSDKRPTPNVERSSNSLDRERREFSDQSVRDRGRDSGIRNGETAYDENSGAQNDDPGFLAELERKKKEIKEARDRIKKARAKRYAKRAIGSVYGDSLADHDDAFLLEFQVITKGKLIGKYKMKIHYPDKITPALIEKVTRSNSTDLIDALSASQQVG